MPPHTDHTPLSAASLSKWFTEEVQPHLRSYLRRAFPAVRDVDYVVQDSYLRLGHSRPAQPIRSAKAFLFSVARPFVVTEGRVAVARASALPLTAEALDARLGWRNLRFEFAGTALGDAVAQLNRRNRTQLLLADPAPAGLRVSCVFRADNPEGLHGRRHLRPPRRARRPPAHDAAPRALKLFLRGS